MDKTDLRSKRALIVDNGIFVHVALKMAEFFGTTWYWSPYINAFPKSNATLPGDGLEPEGLTRVLDWEDHIDNDDPSKNADIFIFPDVMYGSTQEMLVKMGRRVFGSRRGERLELDRWYLKKLLVKLDMPVAESHLITGMDALRRFLQERKGKYWVKTSRYRGDFETFDVEDYELAKEKLDEIAYKLGKKQAVYPFVVEHDIPAITEVGYDGFSVDGQWADIALLGKEEKDTGLIGVVKPYTDLPEPVKWVNAKISETLASYQYRGLYSTEIRCATEDDFDNPKPKQFEDCPCIWHKGDTVPGTDQYAFLTDPCMRAASPPSELYMEWFHNWGEIVWEAAEGRLATPEPVGKWGVEIMLHSSWADSNWQSVRFPDDIKQFIKLRNVCRIDGQICTVPQGYNLPEIGAAVAVDDSLDTAIATCKERAEAVSGYFIEPKIDAIPKALAAIREAEDAGIDFGLAKETLSETCEAVT